MDQKPTVEFSKADFEAAKADLDSFNDSREEQIRSCRDLIRLSKKVIYALHRDQLEDAQVQYAEMKKKLAEIGEKAFDHNLFTVSVQEFVEAAAFYHVVVDNKLVTRQDLGVETREYLLGLCDLCGELVRRAINSAAKDDVAETVRMKQLVEDLFGMFLAFGFRNGELRKKSDGIKYHLTKLESVLYDLNLHRNN